MHARTRQQIHTLRVLERVFDHRIEQDERYPENLERDADGTGLDVCWLPNIEYPHLTPADVVEAEFRHAYEEFEAKHGGVTWRHLVVEEAAESFREEPGPRLIEELEQVAALCVAWIESLERRGHGA